MPCFFSAFGFLNGHRHRGRVLIIQRSGVGDGDLIALFQRALVHIFTVVKDVVIPVAVQKDQIAVQLVDDTADGLGLLGVVLLLLALLAACHQRQQQADGQHQCKNLFHDGYFLSD